MDNPQEASKKPRMKSLVIDGSKYKTNLTTKFENRVKYETPNPKQMKAFIPGTVAKIFVTEGQKVKAGARLLILEAMKMKNRIEAPFSGKILKIHVKEGDIIPKNHLIIEFE